MSRIGKRPIMLPKGVHFGQKENLIKVDGPKGTLSAQLPAGVEIVSENQALTVKRLEETRQASSYHGLVRTLLNNMVTGVSAGFEKGLIISGVGYRAEVNDKTLKMILGFSAPVEYKIPGGVSVKVEKQVNITVSGIDKQLVGHVAAEIRQLKKPEPYKGKGIRYIEEKIRRKVGKSVGAK